MAGRLDGMIPTSVPAFYRMVARGVLPIAAVLLAGRQRRQHG
jgi:hypothetical protein